MSRSKSFCKKEINKNWTETKLTAEICQPLEVLTTALTSKSHKIIHHYNETSQLNYWATAYNYYIIYFSVFNICRIISNRLERNSCHIFMKTDFWLLKHYSHFLLGLCKFTYWWGKTRLFDCELFCLLFLVWNKYLIFVPSKWLKRTNRFDMITADQIIWLWQPITQMWMSEFQQCV